MGLGQGYPITDEAFDLELFMLVGAFAASQELAQLGEAHEGIERLRVTFEQSEAARRLVGIAVMTRGKLDSRSVARPQMIEQSSSMPVGLLVPDHSKPGESEPLSFREACNKIIHATSIDLVGDSSESASSLSMTVALFGAWNSRQGAREWRADLDLPRFVQAASVL